MTHCVRAKGPGAYEEPKVGAFLSLVLTGNAALGRKRGAAQRGHVWGDVKALLQVSPPQEGHPRPSKRLPPALLFRSLPAGGDKARVPSGAACACAFTEPRERATVRASAAVRAHETPGAGRARAEGCAFRVARARGLRLPGPKVRCERLRGPVLPPAPVWLLDLQKGRPDPLRSRRFFPIQDALGSQRKGTEGTLMHRLQLQGSVPGARTDLGGPGRPHQDGFWPGGGLLCAKLSKYRSFILTSPGSGY